MILADIFRYRDKKSPDKLEKYPIDFHVNAFPERRYLWTARLLAICSVISFALNIILVMTLYVLLPQKNTSAYFYRANEETFSLEKVSKLQENIPLRDLLSEKYITEYIKMRHGIPISSADLFYRWDTNSLFYWYSGLRNYYNFVNNLNQDQLKSFIRMKMKREIEIDKVKKLTDNLWMVQFRTLTSAKGYPEKDVIIWRAYLRIAYIEFDKYADIENDDRDRLNYTSNPFGFKVLTYSLAYAGKPQKADNYLSVAKKVFENLEDVVK